MAKSAFRTIAEMVVFNPDVELPMESLDPVRRITTAELKKIVTEEFKDVKAVSKVKAEELPGWHDAEVENHVDWMKALSIKEFFKK